ncbi:hypothetical protein [Aeromicrobium sp. UC242_57]|uniref:hypothetical protein n=1 Tax=Aeromicrobium sp. UC242_57 TaxID=3374624 RepID=UPI0037994686
MRSTRLRARRGLGRRRGAPSEWEHSRAPVEDVLAIQGISVKPYPCCGHTFAVIDAVLELRSAGLRSDDVESVDVSTYRTAIEVAGIPAPRTVAERRFSISYLAATALVTGEVSESTIVVPEVPPEVASLMTRICLRVGDEFEAAFPQRRGASIELSDRSGSEWSQRVPDRSGSPQNPLTAERIDNKFLDATREVLGDRAPSLLAEVRGLREMSSVLGLSLH